MKKQNFRIRLLSVLCISFLTACATGSQQGAGIAIAPTTAQAPDWVNKSCQDPKHFCGVGEAYTIGDYSIGRQEADSLALVKVRGTMETFVGYLLEGYKKKVISGDKKSVSIIGQTEVALKSVIGGTVSGARIVDHWEHPTRSMIFALAKVDLESFKENVEQMGKLSEEFKDYVHQNAERMHQKLDDELEKKGY